MRCFVFFGFGLDFGLGWVGMGCRGFYEKEGEKEKGEKGGEVRE